MTNRTDDEQGDRDDERWRPLEQRLREASSLDDDDDTRQKNTRLVTHRAERELAWRDVVGFGFAHLLGTLLTLVSGIHRVYERAKNPDTHPENDHT